MDRDRLAIIGIAAAMVVVSVLGWVLGVSPQLQQATRAEQAIQSAAIQNAAYEAQLASLKKDFDGIADLKTNLAALRTSVPHAADLPVFVGEADAVARANKVTITSISVEDAAPSLALIDAPAAASASAAGGGTSTQPAADGDQLTGDNFLAIPVSIELAGDDNAVLGFVDGLQSGSRLVLVSGIKTSHPEGGGTVATISAFVYVLLDASATPAQQAAETQAQAAG